MGLSSTTDTGATPEADHQFSSGDVTKDNGVYIFVSGVTFAHVGTKTVTATAGDVVIMSTFLGVVSIMLWPHPFAVETNAAPGKLAAPVSGSATNKNRVSADNGSSSGSASKGKSPMTSASSGGSSSAR